MGLLRGQNQLRRTAEEQQATTASPSANIADGVRSLIKSNPDLAGKNRRG